MEQINKVFDSPEVKELKLQLHKYCSKMNKNTFDDLLVEYGTLIYKKTYKEVYADAIQELKTIFGREFGGLKYVGNDNDIEPLDSK